MKLAAADVLRVAADAVADVRTVRKYLRGDVVRESVAARIEAAVRKLGLEGSEA